MSLHYSVHSQPCQQIVVDLEKSQRNVFEVSSVKKQGKYNKSNHVHCIYFMNFYTSTCSKSLPVSSAEATVSFSFIHLLTSSHSRLNVCSCRVSLSLRCLLDAKSSSSLKRDAKNAYNESKVVEIQIWHSFCQTCFALIAALS